MITINSNLENVERELPSLVMLLKNELTNQEILNMLDYGYGEYFYCIVEAFSSELEDNRNIEILPNVYKYCANFCFVDDRVSKMIFIETYRIVVNLIKKLSIEIVDVTEACMIFDLHHSIGFCEMLENKMNKELERVS